jgi:hypothetical protein
MPPINAHGIGGAGVHFGTVKVIVASSKIALPGILTVILMAVVLCSRSLMSNTPVLLSSVTDTY